MNLLDYGARLYSGHIPGFTTMDPLSEKYHWISPYAYCNNNPIRYVDPDGRKIVDVNGNLMWEDGKWTKYATPDAMRIGIAMRATDTGMKHFNEMAGSNTKTHLELSPGSVQSSDGNYTLGAMEPGKHFLGSNGNVILKEATIVIFEGSIKDFLNVVRSTDDSNLGEREQLYKNISVNQAIGAVAGHEKGHTEQKNLNQNREEAVRKKTNQKPIHDLEKRPHEIETKILQEFNLKNK